MTTRFWIGVVVGAVGAHFLWGRSASEIGVGGARGTPEKGRNSRYSGLGRFR